MKATPGTVVICSYLKGATNIMSKFTNRETTAYGHEQ